MEKKYLYHLNILNIYLLFIISALVSAVGSSELQCSFNLTVKNKNNLENICTFLSGRTWDEADTTCKLSRSYLKHSISENSPLHAQLNDRGVDLLWVGIRRRENYFIVLQQFDSYSTLFNEKVTKRQKWGQSWAYGEPRHFDCVALSITNGSLFTRDCNSSLPFACQSKGSLPTYGGDLGCPDGWVLSVALSTSGRKCVYSVNESRSYSEAEKVCKEQESHLATKKEYEILHANHYLPATDEDSAYWSEGEDSKPCPFFKYFAGANGASTKNRSTNCLIPLPFVCVKSLETEDVDVKVIIGPDSHAPVLTYQVFPGSSTCGTDDLLICDVKVKDKKASDDRKLIHQWFKDGIPIPFQAYVFRISYIGDGFKWSYGNSPCVRQGSYHCEVRFDGSSKIYSSQKIDFFYSDMATYVISLHGLNIKKYTDYSQGSFNTEMKKLNKKIHPILGKENFKFSDALWDFGSTSINGDTFTMKLLIYVNRTADFEDENVYGDMKSLFQNNANKMGYGQDIYVRVNSADVCYTSELNSSDTCSNKIEWPTTKQTRNVLTDNTCLNEHKKFVHRECKGSTVNKAKWSSFDCSVCKEFRERYQDEVLQCPDGYSKFNKQDLCFKVFHEKKNWTDAYKTCAKDSSYMFDEQSSNDIGLIDSFWISYKYSYGKIQGFGMKPINVTFLSEKIKMLLETVEWRNHQLHCVSAVLENYKYKFTLENCSKEISFVCIREIYELNSSVKFASTWTRFNTVKRCYYFENSLFSWRESEDVCKKTFFGSKLLHGIQDINSYRFLKKLVVDQFNESECDAMSWWMNFEHVIKDGMSPAFNYTDWSPSVQFNLKEPHGVLSLFPDKKVYWSLVEANTKLKLICEMEDCDDPRPTQAYIEDRSNSFDSPQSFIQNFQLKCIPSGWFITNSFSWYKDGILMDEVSDELSFSIARIGTEEDALNCQGYYSCSVDCAKTRKAIHSSKHLLRVPGFYTFVLSMISESETYLSDCAKYMLSYSSYKNTSLVECFNNNLKDFKYKDCRNTSCESWFLVKNLTCDSSRVDIRVHVYFKEDNGDEEKIFEMIKDTEFLLLYEACKIEPNSISVHSTDSCYRDTVELTNRNLTWPATSIGKTAFPDEPCVTDEGTLIERKCMGDFNSGAVWSDVPIRNCRNISSPVTKGLYEILNLDIQGTIDSLHLLPNLTSSPRELQPIDVQLTVGILGNLANLTSFPSKRLENVVKTVSNMIDAPQEVLLKTKKSSNQIIEYFERITANIDEEYEEKNISTKNVFVNIYPYNSITQEMPNCVYLSNSSVSSILNASAEDFQVNMTNYEAGIVLPNSLLEEKSNVSQRIVYSIFQNINFIKNIEVLSVIISATLHNVSFIDLGKEEVTLLFKLNKEIQNKELVKCVFWDFDLQTWSYKGCFLRGISNSVICVCNHLTSFTVIMDMDSTSIPESHKIALDHITYIGCSLSCIGFLLIILTFIFFREWRKSLKNKSLFNYSLGHFIFLVTFMAGINNTGSKDLCKVTAVFLHYFLLSSFTWMVVLAYTVYLSLVKVLPTYIPHMIQKAIVFAWGLPTVIVIIVFSYNSEYYSGKELCWLSRDAFYYAIVSPLVLMLIINYTIFATILYLNTCGREHIRTNQERTKLLMARAKALFYTSILLGLSWVFGFLAIGKVKLLFMYIFSITTTFQGFLLAVFFILWPEPTRSMWLKLLFASAVRFKTPYSNVNSTVVTNRMHNNVDSKHESVNWAAAFKAQSRNT